MRRERGGEGKGREDTEERRGEKSMGSKSSLKIGG